MAVIHEIVPGLFQGNHPREIAPHIEAVLNVDYTPAKYESGKLKGYTHLPIWDGPDPGQEWLRNAVDVINSYRKNDWKTYIHCQAGMSRSVFVTAAFLIREYKLTPKEAVTLINSKSGIADPAPAFLLALDTFYKAVQDAA